MPLSVLSQHPGGSGDGFRNVQSTLGNYSVFPGINKQTHKQDNPKKPNPKQNQKPLPLERTFCSIVNDTFFSKYCDSIRSNTLSCVLSVFVTHTMELKNSTAHASTATLTFTVEKLCLFPNSFCSGKLFFFKFFLILQYLDFKYNMQECP